MFRGGEYKNDYSRLQISNVMKPCQSASSLPFPASTDRITGKTHRYHSSAAFGTGLLPQPMLITFARLSANFIACKGLFLLKKRVEFSNILPH
jgi:hypothetical protein